MVPDGFTLDWTTADGTATEFGYVAFGDGPNTTNAFLNFM